MRDALQQARVVGPRLNVKHLDPEIQHMLRKFYSYGFGAPSTLHTFSISPVFPHIILPLLRSGVLDGIDELQLQLALPWLPSTLSTVAALPPSPPTPDAFIRLPTSTTDFRQNIALTSSLVISFDGQLNLLYRFLRPLLVPDGIFTAFSQAFPLLLQFVPLPLLRRYIKLRLVGAPASSHIDVTYETLRAFYQYGNHKKVGENMAEMDRAQEKELQLWSLLVFNRQLFHLLPFLFLAPLGLLLKLNKKPRPLFDATYLPPGATVSLNHLTPITLEHEISYGKAFERYLRDLYLLRLLLPTVILFLMDDDIASAFRIIKNHPDFAAACSYIWRDTVSAYAGTSFGQRPSPPNFMIAADTRSLLAANLRHTHLIEQPHPLENSVKFHVAASPAPCRTIRSDPSMIHYSFTFPLSPFLPEQIYPWSQYPYVDDSLYNGSLSIIRQKIRCSFHSADMIFGPDSIELRKLKEGVCAERKEQLGVIVDSRAMTVELTPAKLAFIAQLTHEWAFVRKTVRLLDIAKLLGTLQFGVTKTSPSTKYLLAEIKVFLRLACKQAPKRLGRSQHFNAVLKLGWINWNTSALVVPPNTSVAPIWKCSALISIPPMVKAAMKLLHQLTVQKSNIWKTPIEFLLERKAHLHCTNDASWLGWGAACLTLRCLLTIPTPRNIQSLTAHHMGDAATIHQNTLELAGCVLAIIMIQCYLVQFNQLQDSPWALLLLNDSITALSRVERANAECLQQRALLRILGIMSYDLNIQILPQHIKGKDNEIADHLSRMTHDPAIPLTHDILLPFAYVQREEWTVFQPTSKLITLICSAMLQPEEILLQEKTLERLYQPAWRDFGSFVRITQLN